MPRTTAFINHGLQKRGFDLTDGVRTSTAACDPQLRGPIVELLPGGNVTVRFVSHGLPVSTPNGLPPAPLRQALAELGYAEGKNAHYEGRWAEGKVPQLPELANELVQRGVDVIAATGWRA